MVGLGVALTKPMARAITANDDMTRMLKNCDLHVKQDKIEPRLLERLGGPYEGMWCSSERKVGGMPRSCRAQVQCVKTRENKGQRGVLSDQRRTNKYNWRRSRSAKKLIMSVLSCSD